MLLARASRRVSRLALARSWGNRCASTFMTEYQAHVKERADEGIVPTPLDAAQAAGLVELMQSPPADEADELYHLLSQRIPPGVDEAAYVKASFLAAVAKGEATSPLVSKVRAIELLGTMMGGYNIVPMVEALKDAELAPAAVEGLSKTLLMFDAFYDVQELADGGNASAKQVMQN